jgi:drug/metabolite transporter (DMT)-like permease
MSGLRPAGVIRIAAILLFCVLAIISAAWATFALYYSGLQSPAARTTLALSFATFAAAALAASLFDRWRRRTLALYAVLFVCVVAWWSTIAPSNDRAWKAEVAVMPRVTLDGERVTVHGIRNFDYRTPRPGTTGLSI